MKWPCYFLHGWAYDASYWQDFIADWKSGTYGLGDWGFFGTSSTLYPQEDFIGIGHSLGFLKMLMDWPNSMRALIGINAFPKFSQSVDFPQGVPIALLHRMKERLASEPKLLLENFWKKNGIPGPKAVPDIPSLQAGLDILMETDCREKLSQLPLGKILALSGGADNILQVRPGEFHPHHHAWLEKGGHNLVHSHAAWCKEKIEHFVGHVE